MTTEALIIFVRNPELGKVKTRLAATLGNEKALLIYKKLLQHTLHISKEVAAAKFIFYADEIIEDDMWQQKNYFKLLQAATDLGIRMKTAFEQVFEKGFSKVCIIGSDCYELTPDIINDAFHALDNNDVVIGPAKDGGYYLLALKKIYPQIFLNKQWSSSRVLAETIKTITELSLRYFHLPMLIDIDEEENLPDDLKL